MNLLVDPRDCETECAQLRDANARLLAILLHLEQAYSNKHSPQHRAAALAEARGVIHSTTKMERLMPDLREHAANLRLDSEACWDHRIRDAADALDAAQVEITRLRGLLRELVAAEGNHYRTFRTALVDANAWDAAREYFADPLSEGETK
jgi:hypothetical protein